VGYVGDRASQAGIVLLIGLSGIVLVGFNDIATALLTLRPKRPDAGADEGNGDRQPRRAALQPPGSARPAARAYAVGGASNRTAFQIAQDRAFRAVIAIAGRG
jgi:hypothetical protein